MNRHAEASERPQLDHLSLGLLGAATISVYGAWYYAFGALFDTIRLDTGWRESSLAASFSAGTVLIGLGSILGGRLLDKAGARPVFLLAAVGGGLAFFTASLASSVVLFTVSSAIGMGFFGAFGFYHVTMTAAVRLHPGSPARAIAVLTLWGAFASAIYLPLAAALLEVFDWRVTARILVFSAVVALTAAAAFVSLPADEASEPSPPLRQVVAATVSSPGPRYFTVTVAMIGVILSTLLVYQVPAMTAAGLPLATATSVAGLRGICQLLGRVPLAGLVNRLGSDGALLLALGSIALGGALLTVSGSVAPALAFAVTAGFGIGAISPLQGIKSEELFDRRTLGATMGFYGTVMMLAGALGPVISGVLADQTGDRRWSSVMVVGSALAGVFFVTQLRRHSSNV